jgi:hypothetical protein
MRRVVLAVLCCVAGCRKEEPRASERLAPPKPLEQLALPALREADGGIDREALFHVAPYTLVGPSAPAELARLKLAGDAVAQGETRYALDTAEGKAALAAALKGPPLAGGVALVPDAETYLAQAAPLLTLLHDAQVPTWLQHPNGRLAVQVTLRDEPGFQAWIDEKMVPGKLRVIHRADGFELQTNMGKLIGVDPNGPSVPVRGGVMDLGMLQQGFKRIKERFTDAADVCFVPSFATPLADAAQAVLANYTSATEATFASSCLVFPRPVAKAP